MVSDYYPLISVVQVTAPLTTAFESSAKFHELDPNSITFIYLKRVIDTTYSHPKKGIFKKIINKLCGFVFQNVQNLKRNKNTKT